jgi:apolipoprotein D and lipocalin family protein
MSARARIALALALVVGVSGCALAPGYRDTRVTIASSTAFDPARFQGDWIEVARYPTTFQAHCAGAVARYALAGPGRLSVENLCLDAQGREIDRIAGRAQVVGPGRLSVRLDGVPVAAPYWVLWVDEGYRVAVVGQPDGRAGWILAREARPAPDLIAAAREVLAFNGYDLNRLRGSVTP